MTSTNKHLKLEYILLIQHGSLMSNFMYFLSTDKIYHSFIDIS